MKLEVQRAFKRRTAREKTGRVAEGSESCGRPTAKGTRPARGKSPLGTGGGRRDPSAAVRRLPCFPTPCPSRRNSSPPPAEPGISASMGGSRRRRAALRSRLWERRSPARETDHLTAVCQEPVSLRNAGQARLITYTSSTRRLRNAPLRRIPLLAATRGSRIKRGKQHVTKSS